MADTKPLRDDVLAWGRAHRYLHSVVTPAFRDQAVAAIPDLASQSSWLPRGLGRSYGDSGLNEGHALLDATQLDRFLAFDESTGVIECEAGVTLPICCNCWSSVRPLPVMALYGSCQSLRAPSSSPSVVRLPTMCMAKTTIAPAASATMCFRYSCCAPMAMCLSARPQSNPSLFAATLGGLGLTGLVLTARLQMQRVPGLWLETEDVRYGGLDEFFALSKASEADWEYDVAWLDCLAKGSALGRGVFSRARHVVWPRNSPPPNVRPAWQPRLAMPFDLPGFALNRVSIGAFNTLLWHKAPAIPKRRVVHYDTVFYPLDAIAQWNRLYGVRGFYQYQCVLPEHTAQSAVREQLQAIAESGEGSFLAVLKTFGPRCSPGLLSFPMPGVTLALDFPNRGARTLALLSRLDAITATARGRIYPAKDGRVSAADFQRGYPNWQSFSQHVDPHCSSSFWRRVSAV